MLSAYRRNLQLAKEGSTFVSADDTKKQLLQQMQDRNSYAVADWNRGNGLSSSSGKSASNMPSDYDLLVAYFGNVAQAENALYHWDSMKLNELLTELRNEKESVNIQTQNSSNFVEAMKTNAEINQIYSERILSMIEDIYQIFNPNIKEYDVINDEKKFVDNSFNYGLFTIGTTHVYDQEEDKQAAYRHFGIHLMPYSFGPQVSKGDVYNVTKVKDYGKHFIDVEFMKGLDGFVHSRWKEDDKPMVWAEGTSDGWAVGPGVGYDFYIPLDEDWQEGIPNVVPWIEKFLPWQYDVDPVEI